MNTVKELLKHIYEGIGDLCLIWRDEMRLTWKDEGVLIFFILVPIFYPLLYSWIYTNEVVREVPVAIVDNSRSHLSRSFIRHFDASPDVEVKCFCGSLDEAKDLIGRQEVYGVLYFPSDFQTKIHRLEQAHVSIYCDMSFMLYYKNIFQTATSVANGLNAKIQAARAGNHTSREDEITTKPLDYADVQMFNTTGGYGNFIIPGVLMLVLQQTLVLGIGLSTGTGREKDRFCDLVPISKHHNGMFRIVFGKALCYLMIYSVVAAYLTLIVPHMFGFVSMLHACDLLLFMLPYTLACIFFAMSLSCAMKHREDIMLMVVFTSVPFLFLSGVSWPQSAIPQFWQYVSDIIPSSFGIRGFVRMNTMGARLEDVLPEYHALWLQVLTYFVITCLVYRYEIIKTRRHIIEALKSKSNWGQKNKNK